MFFDESEVSKAIKTIPDFYSTSEFRDLIFHFQEKQYEIDDLENLLHKYNLKFLGFSNVINFSSKYLKAYPEDKKLINFKNWKEYELNNQDTFLGMYNFWCCKMSDDTEVIKNEK